MYRNTSVALMLLSGVCAHAAIVQFNDYVSTGSHGNTGHYDAFRGDKTKHEGLAFSLGVPRGNFESGEDVRAPYGSLDSPGASWASDQTRYNASSNEYHVTATAGIDSKNTYYGLVTPAPIAKGSIEIKDKLHIINPLMSIKLPYSILFFAPHIDGSNIEPSYIPGLSSFAQLSYTLTITDDLLGTKSVYSFYDRSSGGSVESGHSGNLLFDVRGLNFELDFSVEAIAFLNLREGSGLESNVNAHADYANTVSWGGIDSIFQDGKKLENWSIASDTGINWASPSAVSTVPEPGTYLLFLAGCSVLIERRIRCSRRSLSQNASLRV